MTDYKLAQKSIVDELAQFIRQVDGNNKMGAGSLAEKICERFHVADPAVQGEPVAVVDACDDGMWADILPDVDVKVGQPLYTAPQPAEQQPISHDWDDQDKCRRCGDREKLAGALEEIAQWVDRWASADHPIAAVARKALAAYRNQGGEA